MRPIAELREAALQQTDRDVALFELGLALDRRGESETAGIASVREAVALKPDQPYYHLGLAWLLMYRTAAFEEAVDSSWRALALDPTLWKAAGFLSLLLGSVLDRHAEARTFAAQAVDLNPEGRHLYARLCRTCLDIGGLDQLRAGVEAAAPPRARLDFLREGLGAALMQVGRYDEALRVLQDVVHAAPDNALFLTTLAEAETALGDHEAAAGHLERAFQLAPSDDEVHNSFLSTAWRSGDHDRITAAIMAAGIATSRPMWLARRETDPLGPICSGEALRGQTVLLTDTPNGYGDTVQAARVAPLLQARGVRVILECRHALRALFETVQGAPDVVVPHDSYPPYDHMLYPFWLPLGWTWEELNRVPYFDLPRAVQRTWAQRVHAAGDGMHVGLAWRAANELPNRANPYRRRTIPLRQLEPILAMPGTRCHTLSVGEAAAREIAEIKTRVPLTGISTEGTDFLEAAAVISALDIVVTVDTVFAHLAGALGKPVFLMLPYFSDWRWGRCQTILGYPTVRPFRQTVPGDWAPVIRDVQHALRTFVREQPAQDRDRT